ncbi:hypothetical protein [Streptomyces iranensis]|uniref:hypothetical protein n=1 Tax=Streptomyces iranensis TaxID=576784 RepID=UPI0039B77241
MRAAPEVSGRSQTLFAITRCLPFLVLAAVFSIELSPAHTLYTGPLLSPAPALAAVTMGPVGTVGVAVLAGVVSAIAAIHNDAWGTPQVYTNLLALLVVAVASVATSAVRVPGTASWPISAGSPRCRRTWCCGRCPPGWAW